jgi:hypothetical protein
MNIYLRAALHTLASLAAIFALAFGLVFFVSFVGTATALNLFYTLLFLFGAGIFYSLNLSRLKYYQQFPKEK